VVLRIGAKPVGEKYHSGPEPFTPAVDQMLGHLRDQGRIGSQIFLKLLVKKSQMLLDRGMDRV
jgi:hypothetical protein